MLEPSLVRIVCSDEITLTVKGGTFAAPALGPVGLDLRCLFSVVEGTRPVLLGGVCGRAVAVEDVVFGLDGNGLGELVAERQS